MRVDYLLKRIGVFFVLVWVAASLNFIGPRLTGKDPIKTRLLKQACMERHTCLLYIDSRQEGR